MTACAPRLTLSVPDARLATDLGGLPDGVELIEWAMDGPAPRERIDIVVPPYMNAGRVFPWLAGVTTRLVQGQSIGYDGVAAALPPGHLFANAAGVHETSTAEFALALLLAAQRRLPEVIRSQQDAAWRPVFADSLADRRVLLLGYGGVGRAIAARLRPCEVELTIVARTARADADAVVHGIDELDTLLRQAEIVVAALPGGDETRQLIDDRVLTLLPDGALIVNVGRGPLIDTDALLAHAARGRIRAALDVTDPEPLPEGHPLWSAPGVLIAPHMAGGSSAMIPRGARLLRTQIDRMLRGEEPLNVVLDTR